jgi:hypothetical protein
MIGSGGLLLVVPTPICTHHNDSSRWFAISSPHTLFAPITMIRPGGLLLVVPHTLFAVPPVSVCWVGSCKKGT